MAVRLNKLLREKLGDCFEEEAPDFGSTEQRDQASIQQRLDWCEQTIQRAESARQKSLQSGNSTSAVRWRRVARPALTEALRGKLAQHACVAVVGMSGTGKTFLMEQFAERDDLIDPVLLIAPKPVGQERKALRPSHFLPLGLHIAKALAGRTTTAADDRCKAIQLNLRGDLEDALDTCRRLHGLGLAELERHETEILGAHRAKALVNGLVAVIELAQDFNFTMAALKLALAPAAARSITPSRPLTFLIDDVWSPEFAVQLFDCLKPEGVGPGPIRVAFSSQTIAVLDEDARIHLDRDEADRRRFGFDLVAAWAAPAGEYTSGQGLGVVEAFAAGQLSNPGLRAEIDGVGGLFGYHPLAVSAVASNWRIGGYQPDFWRNFAEAMRALDLSALQFDEANVYVKDLNPAHREVARALLLALGPMPEDLKERFLDLSTSPRGFPIDRAIFTYFWRRVSRGNLQLQPHQSSDAVLRQFEERSLLQLSPSGSTLHDMHRLVIEATLGREGIADRHLQLLDASGFVENGRGLSIDNDLDFAQTPPADPEDPLSTRVVFWPRLKALSASRAIGDAERRAIARYYADQLQFHLRQISRVEGFEDAEVKLLHTFNYLKSLIDWVE